MNLVKQNTQNLEANELFKPLQTCYGLDFRNEICNQLTELLYKFPHYQAQADIPYEFEPAEMLYNLYLFFKSAELTNYLKTN
jgi:hypothetical protein